MDRNNILSGLEDDIKKVLYGYIQAKSFTNTEHEKEAENFLMNYFSKIPYFASHPEHYGTYPIKEDGYERSVCFAMVRGDGADTIVFVHHNDVVDIEDFKLLKPLAFSPDELEDSLLAIADRLPDEASSDIKSGNYLFGRGVADMKGGGAIQLSLLERYSRLSDFKGNIIALMVPDEENLSAGMRAGVCLLDELQNKYNLKYRLMINSEPHQRKRNEEGIFSEGSIGKVMPFVYVQGTLSHIGKVFEGFNPVMLMSEIVRETELNMDFSDSVGDECAPPPTWLYLKDSKEHYDVSVPLSMYGCLSVLTLTQTPEEILKRLCEICEKAFDTVINDMNKSYDRFCKQTVPVAGKLPWRRKVSSFDELFNEAADSYGISFLEKYAKVKKQIASDIGTNALGIAEGNNKLIAFVFDYISDYSPRVVYGIIPPYYPSVSNRFAGERTDDSLKTIITEFASKSFHQKYVREYYYTGISDLSYSYVRGGRALRELLKKQMPLFGALYDIPFEKIEKISMPCINIGPWGKDFHKLTERVFKEDLFIRTPAIINEVVMNILDE